MACAIVPLDEQQVTEPSVVGKDRTLPALVSHLRCVCVCVCVCVCLSVCVFYKSHFDPSVGLDHMKEIQHQSKRHSLLFST